MKATSIALIVGLFSCAFVQPLPAAEAAKFREKVLWSFGNGTDGQYPYAGLINVKGMLYGTTFSGGSNGGGIVFSVNRKTGAETVIYNFCSEHNCVDGENPWGGLLDVKGALYGTTFRGGAGFDEKFGTAFALDPNTGSEKVLYSFCSEQNCQDGANPIANLININGVLYGTTDSGGASSYGAAFALDPNTGTESVLYNFCSQQNCTDGQNPASAFIAMNGTLYGTTSAGGAFGCGNGLGCGTAYSLDPSTGAETVLHSFGGGTDGRVPQAGLVAVNSLLYGTSYGGGVTGCGAFGCGTVFSIDPNTGAEKVLHSFFSQQNCKDGANPFASLISVAGLLYGTTYAGGGTGCGGGGCGTVFSVDPNTGVETVLYSFLGGPDGANPESGLVEVKDMLYGTTDVGGAYGYGTVFAIKKKH